MTTGSVCCCTSPPALSYLQAGTTLSLPRNASLCLPSRHPTEPDCWGKHMGWPSWSVPYNYQLQKCRTALEEPVRSIWDHTWLWSTRDESHSGLFHWSALRIDQWTTELGTKLQKHRMKCMSRSAEKTLLQALRSWSQSPKPIPLQSTALQTQPTNVTAETASVTQQPPPHAAYREKQPPACLPRQGAIQLFLHCKCNIEGPSWGGPSSHFIKDTHVPC